MAVVTTVGAGETASETLEIGAVEQVAIEAEEGKLLSINAGDKGFITVLTQPGVNMGLVEVAMDDTTEEIVGPKP